MSNKLLGNLPKGLLFILSAPAGTGKTTLAKMLTEEFSSIRPSISCTTRPQRPGEVDGKDYLFTNEAAFQKKVQEGAFLEHATIFGRRYGTLRQTVEELQENGKHVLLVIDTQGMQQLRKHRIPYTAIFLLPPSWKTLEERLRQRGTENSEQIAERIRHAQAEVASAHLYDHSIMNDDLKTAYEVLRSVFIVTENKERTWNIPKNI